MIGQFLMLGFSVLLPVFFGVYSPILTTEILKDLRILRILHYVALAGLGMALYLRTADDSFFSLTFRILPVFLLFMVALVYAAVFAIITNNIEDLEADKISNPGRPLVRNRVTKAAYYRAGVFCQVYALLLAFLVQDAMFLGILAISVGYYIYSCPPFRLKKFPFLAKGIIGFNSLAVALCGFVLAGGHLFQFPAIWIFYILVPLSLAANFVDLKDTAGDGQTGILTLPVLWGEHKARFFIACCTIVAYGMAGFLLRLVWVYPLLLLVTSVHIWLLYRKPYDEKPIFLVYVSALLSLDICLFFTTQLF
ncbi:MAG: UbiA family prenyltransferase [Bacteroidetes bacterium]|nr:UbiA family prenyltransferase [Bacteroidota bacterium]